MTSLKNVVLICTVILASIAAVGVLWARAAGTLAPGDAGPIFGVITMGMLAVTIWASRVRTSSAKID